jgi:hypothetical protein
MTNDTPFSQMILLLFTVSFPKESQTEIIQSMQDFFGQLEENVEDVSAYFCENSFSSYVGYA